MNIYFSIEIIGKGLNKVYKDGGNMPVSNSKFHDKHLKIKELKFSTLQNKWDVWIWEFAKFAYFIADKMA